MIRKGDVNTLSIKYTSFSKQLLRFSWICFYSRSYSFFTKTLISYILLFRSNAS